MEKWCGPFKHSSEQPLSEFDRAQIQILGTRHKLNLIYSIALLIGTYLVIPFFLLHKQSQEGSHWRGWLFFIDVGPGTIITLYLHALARSRNRLIAKMKKSETIEIFEGKLFKEFSKVRWLKKLNRFGYFFPEIDSVQKIEVLQPVGIVFRVNGKIISIPIRATFNLLAPRVEDGFTIHTHPDRSDAKGNRASYETRRMSEAEKEELSKKIKNLGKYRWKPYLFSSLFTAAIFFSTNSLLGPKGWPPIEILVLSFFPLLIVSFYRFYRSSLVARILSRDLEDGRIRIVTVLLAETNETRVFEYLHISGTLMRVNEGLPFWRRYLP